MNIERVAVIGGSGFVGRHLANHLRNRGYACRVITRHPHRHRALQTVAEVVSANPFNPTELTAALIGGAGLMASNASAWWGGPGWGDGWGSDWGPFDGDGWGDFNMSMSGGGRGYGRGRGYGYGYGYPYYGGYGPYGYGAPYGAPYGYGAPVAPAVPVPVGARIVFIIRPAGVDYPTGFVVLFTGIVKSQVFIKFVVFALGINPGMNLGIINVAAFFPGRGMLKGHEADPGQDLDPHEKAASVAFAQIVLPGSGKKSRKQYRLRLRFGFLRLDNRFIILGIRLLFR